MIIDCPTDKVDHHYRDPKVWKTGDIWYMTFGVSSADKRGQMWLFSSKDMVRWEYERVLFQHPDPDVFMLECPDFFPIKDKDGNEKWVIGFSAMGSKPSGFMNRNVSNAGYMIGTWDAGRANSSRKPSSACGIAATTTTPRSPSMMDEPSDRLWLDEPVRCSRFPWRMTAGAASSPCRARSPWATTAIVAHRAGRRNGRPARGYHSIIGAITLDVNGEQTIADDAEAVEIEMTIDLAASTAERAGLKIHATEDGAYTYVAL